MDDLSNRERPQGPEGKLTPAEREALKRRLDESVEPLCERVLDGPRHDAGPEKGPA